VVLGAGPLLFLWGLGALWCAALLKRQGVRTGITRKVFHFVVFASAGLLQWGFGTPLLCLFGGMVSLVVLYAVLRGNGHPLYEALAREGDAPHRTWYIVVPYVATAVGGLCATFWFHKLALAGFLVTGIADAIAEPVGVRWGKHRYRVLLPGRVASWRSLEGSTAVFLGSLVALAVTAAGLARTPLGGAQLLAIVAIALACTALEAVSPHGWDNLVLQVVPAWLMSWLLLNTP
jgi:phytol kinase